MPHLKNKLVAVLNKNLDPGVAKNALAHMAIGLGAALGNEALMLDTYIDADGYKYPNISKMPFIILRAKPGEIRKTARAARENDIAYSVFLNTMTGGTFEEQLHNTQDTKEDELEYYGCILFGEFEEVSELTKKFSVWK